MIHAHVKPVAPTVIALDILLFRKFPQPKVIASVFVVCMGIAVSSQCLGTCGT